MKRLTGYGPIAFFVFGLGLWLPNCLAASGNLFVANWSGTYNARQETGPVDARYRRTRITLKVVDRQGRPLAGVTATVVRPEGPLAEALWPREFTSDGAGAIHIPALETGTHRVQVRSAKDQLVAVPPLADMNSIDIAEPIVVAQE